MKECVAMVVYAGSFVPRLSLQKLGGVLGTRLNTLANFSSTRYCLEVETLTSSLFLRAGGLQSTCLAATKIAGGL